MMRRYLSAGLFWSLIASCAFAQSSPFDMSPERPAGSSPAPVPSRPPSPVQPPVALPPVVQPVAPQPVQPPQVRSQSPLPAPIPPAVSTPATVKVEQDGDTRRYVLPYEKLTLSGEMDQRQWSFYITPEQVNAAVSLNIGYQNAVVVAPESSTLQVSLNNVPLEAVRIEAPDVEGTVSLKIPQGVLQTGANILTLGAEQRHRTDCTIQSTYDLWTEIDPAETYIDFNSNVSGRFTNLDDIQATGLDENAATSIEIVAPGLANPAFASSLLRLSQALALRTQMPNQNIRIVSTLPLERKAGTLVVLVGTARELAAISKSLPPEAFTAAFADFENGVVDNLSPLLVSGPTLQAVDSAIETLFTPMVRAPGTQRATLATKAWHAPDVPLVLSDRRIPLSELGLQSSEFAGRRFRTDFYIGMPADFYASAYGEASLLLDAAYSSKVLPGSHIDVYVNGNIASTVPISNNGGGIFRHLPIKVTMRHFQPGPNRVTLEAVLMTAEDQACAPGATTSATPRFALFDTSEMHIPDYARVGRKPDLAAMAGTGRPYPRGEDPVAVSLDRFEADTMSAAATLVSRIAVASGRPMEIETVASPMVIGDRDALFVGMISQLPQALISQFNLAPTSQVAWKTGTTVQAPAQNQNVLFDQWRGRGDGGIWQGQVSSLEEWLKRNFDLSSDTLRFLPSAEQFYSPPDNVSFMLAQGLSPSGEGVWTLATAPTATELREGVSAMTHEDRWRQVSGRVAAYDGNADKIETVEVERPHMDIRQPFSIWNWRLIAANWLSSNVFSYSLAFIGFVTILGIATFSMLRLMGRKR